MCIVLAAIQDKTVFEHMRYEKTGAVTAQLSSTFIFATWIVQSLFYLNPKFQASSHLLWVYIQVCVGPGRKPQRPVFSRVFVLTEACTEFEVTLKIK